MYFGLMNYNNWNILQLMINHFGYLLQQQQLEDMNRYFDNRYIWYADLISKIVGKLKELIIQTDFNGTWSGCCCKGGINAPKLSINYTLGHNQCDLIKMEKIYYKNFFFLFNLCFMGIY